jgi:hypothetical protein
VQSLHVSKKILAGAVKYLSMISISNTCNRVWHHLCSLKMKNSKRRKK